MSKVANRLALISVSGLCGLTMPDSANAEDLAVLSAAAVKAPVELVPLLENARGNQVRFTFGTAGAMRDRAVNGTPFDVIIVPPATMTELVKQNLVVESSTRPLGVVRLGAAVAKGASYPDMGNQAAIKAALLAAHSIGIADPAKGATTGIYLTKLFGTMGIAEEIKPKLKLYPDGQQAMEAVAKHEVAIAMGQISEAVKVAGLEPLMPLPDEIQLKSIYTAALATHTTHPTEAAQLIELMLGPETQASFKTNGFDPAQ